MRDDMGEAAGCGVDLDHDIASSRVDADGDARPDLWRSGLCDTDSISCKNPSDRSAASLDLPCACEPTLAEIHRQRGTWGVDERRDAV